MAYTTIGITQRLAERMDELGEQLGLPHRSRVSIIDLASSVLAQQAKSDQRWALVDADGKVYAVTPVKYWLTDYAARCLHLHLSVVEAPADLEPYLPEEVVEMVREVWRTQAPEPMPAAGWGFGGES